MSRFGVSRARGHGERIHRIDFWFPGGHGKTWRERYGKRRKRHLSVWFGQSREDVNRYRGPRYTLSLDLYKEPK